MDKSNVVFCNAWGNSSYQWEDLLEEFLIFKSDEGKSDRTVLDYRNHVTRFFRAYPDVLCHPSSLKKSILEYLKIAKTPTTYNLRLQNLRVFFDWLMEQVIYIRLGSYFEKGDRVYTLPSL